MLPGRILRERLTRDVNLHAAAQRREYAAVVDAIVADRPGLVLDWGCGFGLISHDLKQRGLDVVSTDYEPDEPGRRPSGYFPDVEIEFLAEPVALPFPDGTFDAVLSLGVLEHVADPENSLDELHRVLRPGGKLYVYKLPNRFSWLEWLGRRLKLEYHGSRPDDTLYTVRSAVALIERHGFAVESARWANMLPLTLPGELIARVSGPLWWLNKLLARVPGLNRLATNVEVMAIRI